jgi:hypothetical protein
MSFSTRASGPVLLVLLATGCGRKYLIGSEDDRPPPASASGTDGGPIVGVSDPSPETVAAACAAPLGDRLWINTIPELRAAMLGRWFRCPSTPTPDGDGGTYPVYAFGGQLGDPIEAGIELDAGAQFRVFDWGNGNIVVPRPGLLNGGTYVFLVTGTDDSGHPRIQLNFDFDSGSTGLTVPVLSNVPRVVLLAEQFHYIAETR